MSDAPHDFAKALGDARRLLDLYDRVHGELEDGKPWAEIDNGFRDEERPASYEQWSAYMTTRLINALRGVLYSAD